MDRVKKMDEMIDVVDEQDIVLGQSLKSACHHQKLLHRGAAVLVFSHYDYKEVLLQQRSSRMKSYPLKWCFPGGHLGAGEDYLIGASRELREEIFHEAAMPSMVSLEELFKFKKFADNDYEFNTVYRTVTQGPFYPDPAEVETVRFVGINKLSDDIAKNPLDYTGTARQLWEEYQKRYPHKATRGI